MVSKAICFCEVYIKTGGIVVLIAVDGNECGITAAVGLLRVLTYTSNFCVYENPIIGTITLPGSTMKANYRNNREV